MIWDLHCHLSGVEGRTPDERIAKLMRYADRMGVERLVFFMGFPWSQDPAPDELKRQNDQVLQALTHWHDRAFGFVYLSGKHVEASLEELDRCVRDGPLVGVKLWVASRASAEGLDAIIRRAGELKAVVFQHTWLKADGNLAGESTPEDLVALARRHPGASLICGHSGGDWERGIRAVRGQKNISLGTGGFDPTAGYTEMAVRELGAERVIYGSDIGGRSFASQLAKITGAEIPEHAKRLILGENLKRMLAPILREKGILDS
ncbi:MAG: amidohydrolase family protein [Pirellulaceae bacterium]